MRDRGDEPAGPQMGQPETTLAFPPILGLVMPALILVSSVVYAWSLRGIRLPEMNLLLLRPLLALLWILLAVVIVRETLPELRLQRAWTEAMARDRQPWSKRLAPGTEPGALLVLVATFAFSFFGPGKGVAVYVVSLFAYALAVGMLMGERRPVPLLFRAAAITASLYVVMGFLLKVRF